MAYAHPPIPTPEQINECVHQIITNQPLTANARTQAYAQLRLADLQSCLIEWNIDQSHLSPQFAAFPAVAKAIKQHNLPTEQAKKLLVFIQHHAKQGHQTALLYWAYLHATGKYIPQNLAKTASILHYLQQKNDWRATRFLGELLVAAPQAGVDLYFKQTQTTVQDWQRNRPAESLTDALRHAQAFMQQDQAIRYLARTQFELATKQGSPTATQRIKTLISTGQLSNRTPPMALCNLTDWLNIQSDHKLDVIDDSSPIRDPSDPSITVFSDKVPTAFAPLLIKDIKKPIIQFLPFDWVDDLLLLLWKLFKLWLLWKFWVLWVLWKRESWKRGKS